MLSFVSSTTASALLLLWTAQAVKLDNPFPLRDSALDDQDLQHDREMPLLTSVFDWFGDRRCQRELRECQVDAAVPPYDKWESYLAGMNRDDDDLIGQIQGLVQAASSVDFAKAVAASDFDSRLDAASQQDKDELWGELQEGANSGIDTTPYEDTDVIMESGRTIAADIATYQQVTETLWKNSEKLKGLKPRLDDILGADSELAKVFEISSGILSVTADFQTSYCPVCIIGGLAGNQTSGIIVDITPCQRCLLTIGAVLLSILWPVAIVVLIVAGTGTLLAFIVAGLVVAATALVSLPFRLIIRLILLLLGGRRRYRTECGAKLMQCEFDDAMNTALGPLVAAAKVKYTHPHDTAEMTVQEVLVDLGL